MSEATEVLVTARPATADDDAFLQYLYGTTRAAELALVPWLPAQREAFIHLQFTAQRQHYRHEFPDAREAVLWLGTARIGRLYTHERAAELRLLDFSLLPEFHTHTGAAQFLRELIATAKQPVTINLTSSDPLHGFFAKLGFTACSATDAHTLYEVRGASVGAP